MKYIATIAALLLFTSIGTAAPVNKLVVFGDSLSDNGNLYEYMKHQLPLSPPYFEGRFSNGPVWVEHLAALYYPSNSQAHLFDYAFGGAGVFEGEDDDGFFTLRREMDSYFLAHQDKADEQSMYVVWIGSNNYLAALDDEDKVVQSVTVGIQHGLERLVEKGAKHILVLGAPDLGRIPAARDFDSVEVFSALSNKHNQILKTNVSNLQNRHPEVQFIYYDINEAFNDMLDRPEQYGFTDTTGTCYEEADLIESPGSRSVLKMVAKVRPHDSLDICKGYLFFDPVHPTVLAHQLVAERAKALLDQFGVVFQE